MRREELVMDILGGLDEKFVTEAMPRDEGYDLKTEVHYVQFKETATNEAELKRYRRMRTVRAVALAAAAAVLLIGIGFLWGTLKVGNDIASYVPPVADSGGYIAHYDFENCSLDIVSCTFDGLTADIMYDITFAGSPNYIVQPPIMPHPEDTSQPYTAQHRLVGKMTDRKYRYSSRVVRFDPLWEQSSHYIMKIAFVDVSQPQDSINSSFSYTAVLEQQPYKNSMLGVYPNASIVLDDGTAATVDAVYIGARTITLKLSGIPENTPSEPGDIDIVVWLSDGTIVTHESYEPKLRYDAAWAGGSSYTVRPIDGEIDVSQINAVDVNGVPVYRADPLEQITDTSMPLYSHFDSYDSDIFVNGWKRKFTEISGYAGELTIGEQSERLGREYMLYHPQTPYTLDNCYGTYYWWCSRLGVPLSDLCDALEKNNERYSGAVGLEEMVFTTGELGALRSGVPERIAGMLASPYSIVVDDKVFSPKWMYYHTEGNYRAVGITPEQVKEKMPLYEELGLPDEAWAAFKAKLSDYTRELDKLQQEKRTYTADISGLQRYTPGDSAFKVLEEAFYGVWVADDDLDDERLIPLTYTEDRFVFTTHISPEYIGETDDIWYLVYIYGGVSESYVIEKSDPDVMYCANAYVYFPDDDLVRLEIYPGCKTYSNRRVWREPALYASSRLSVLGQLRLLNIMGKDFEEFFNETEHTDIYDGFTDEEGRVWVQSMSLAVPQTERYLREYSDNGAELTVAYYDKAEYDAYNDNITGDPPQPVYFTLAFTKGADGSWSVTHTPVGEGFGPIMWAGYWVNGTQIPSEALAEWDVDKVTANALSRGDFSDLDAFLATLGNDEVALLYKQAYALRTVTFRDNEDFVDTELLEEFYGSNYNTPEVSPRAWLCDDTGHRLARSTGFRYQSVYDCYRAVFTDSYTNELFAEMSWLYKYGDELFAADVTGMRVCSPEYSVVSQTDSEIVIRENCYERDYTTGERTDNIVLVNDNRFVKTDSGWRCAYFGLNDTPE